MIRMPLVLRDFAPTIGVAAPAPDASQARMLYWLHHQVNNWSDSRLPRKYELGKRAERQAATRRRIIAAALELYQEQGVSTTTMRDVALRADVAPGTVANHFGSATALATEATGEILGELQMPSPELFDGVVGLRARVDLLVRELSAFFDRAGPWWRASQHEGPGVSFWAEAEARYYRQLNALVRAALGPLASDEDAVAVVMTVFGRWVIGSLQQAGRTSGDAQSLVADLLASWLETRTPPESIALDAPPADMAQSAN
jgi:AcrR family transcriptional regulator